MNTDLLSRWLDLVGRQCSSRDMADTGRALIDSWDEPHRRYHTLAHLRDVLQRVDELADHASDPDAVRLAAWYHDAVYRGQPDDEENSALRADAELTALGVPDGVIREVARLVRLTAKHNPEPGDRNGETLSDADLAILGASSDQYTAVYAPAVRAEYAHVPDDAFRAGRALILRQLLSAPTLYRTPLGRRRWEAAARANLSAEVQRLGS